MKMKKCLFIIFYIMMMFNYVFASDINQYSNDDIYSVDFGITILINFIITVFAYCLIPVILRIKNGKYEYEKGHKIVIINCIIVWLIFLCINISQGGSGTSAAVIVYYFINRTILLKSKNNVNKVSFDSENRKIEKIDKEENLTEEESKVLKNVENMIFCKELKKAKVRKTKANKTTKNIVCYIIIAILIIIIALLGLYMYTLQKNYENEIETLEARNKTLETKVEKLELKKLLVDIYEEKVEFFDNNIVFVIDGYGNYYYTYDQMKQVTQGIGRYTYWAYNREQAISRGYRAWK